MQLFQGGACNFFQRGACNFYLEGYATVFKEGLVTSFFKEGDATFCRGAYNYLINFFTKIKFFYITIFRSTQTIFYSHNMDIR
jgi:hypothetical protein